MQDINVLAQLVAASTENGETSTSLSCNSDLTLDLACPAWSSSIEAGFSNAQLAATWHACFFLGPQRFYEALRLMDRAEREQFAMTGIAFVNQLYGQEELKHRAGRAPNRAVFSTRLVGPAARLDRPHCFNPTLPRRPEHVVEVNSRVAVARDELHVLADPEISRRILE